MYISMPFKSTFPELCRKRHLTPAGRNAVTGEAFSQKRPFHYYTQAQGG